MRTEKTAALLKTVEAAAAQLLETIRPRTEPKLFDAMSYALNGGGKRVRPVLMLLTGAALQVPQKSILPFALALECVHIYSLTHDDLPAMDNDDFRRGKPSVHKKFDEATAILAGDALLNLAYETLFSALNDEKTRKAAAFIAECAGAYGMVGGQAEEFALAARKKPLEKEEGIQKILAMYEKKTGALLTAAIYVPFLLSDAAEKTGALLLQFAKQAGLLFQLTDDLLDYNDGSDADALTLATFAGETALKTQIIAAEKEALALLDALSFSADDLKNYVRFLANRSV